MLVFLAGKPKLKAEKGLVFGMKLVEPREIKIASATKNPKLSQRTEVSTLMFENAYFFRL